MQTVQAQFAPMPRRQFAGFLREASQPQLQAEAKRLHSAVKAFGPNVRTAVRDELDSQLRELRDLRSMLMN